MLEGSDYHSLPTEQEKRAKRSKMHKARPSLGAANDRRKAHSVGETEAEELQRINDFLDSKPLDFVDIKQLSDKYGLEPKKVRQLIRKLGYKAQKPDPHKPPVYSFPHDSPELHEIEASLAKKGS